MASSLRISAVGIEGNEIFGIEPDWWNMAKIYQVVTPQWVVTNDTGSYTDRDADITIEQMAGLYKILKPDLMKTIKLNMSGIDEAKRRPDKHASVALKQHIEYGKKLKGYKEKFESALKDKTGKVSHFHLRIFDWDSGL